MEKNLPKGWMPTELIQVSNFIDYRGKTPKKTSEGTPLITAKNVKKGYISREPREYIAEEDYDGWMTRGFPKVGDILITTEAPLGNVAQVDINEKFALAQRVITIQLDKRLNSTYLKYYLVSEGAQRDLIENSTGTTVSGIKASRLKKISIPFPPLAEQKRIVAKLDTLFASLEKTKTRLDRIPELLKNFKQAILTQAVTGKLTEDINNGKAYAYSKLDSFCESSFYGPRFSKEDYTEAGYATVRTTDMTNDGFLSIKPDTPRIHISDPKKLELYRVNKGDLLVTRTGSIGKMARYKGVEIVIPSAYLIRFRFTDKVLTDFIYYCLTSPYGQQVMGLSAIALTQPNLNAKKIREIDIPLVSIKEQTEIVRRVESLFAKADTIEEQYNKLKQKVDTLPQAILAKAFRGELVAQNPLDEPASVLLEKIKSLRKAEVKVKPKQKKEA